MMSRTKSKFRNEISVNHKKKKKKIHSCISLELHVQLDLYKPTTTNLLSEFALKKVSFCHCSINKNQKKRMI